MLLDFWTLHNKPVVMPHGINFHTKNASFPGVTEKGSSLSFLPFGALCFRPFFSFVTVPKGL